MTLKETEERILDRLSQMRQCPHLLEQALKLIELQTQMYSHGGSARITFHFADGLISKIEKSEWERWERETA